MSLAGRTVSHYKIVEEISRGGMGAREYHGRFLKSWRDGDIDRNKVQEALKNTS